jgi:hypothetical protein
VNIRKATTLYEQWLSTFTPLVAADLDYKHQQMATGAFPFLRSTFYRWMQVWPDVCHELATAPTVLSVGDLHVENFGTWRDREGRLVWGVNDFDESAHLPYTNDLVRLTASAYLAITANHLCVECVDAGNAILAGYRAGLKAGGRPFVLAEENAWLRGVAFSSLRDPIAYWQKLDALAEVKLGVPETALNAIEHVLPVAGMPYVVKHRVAGLGSLGHPRYVAIGNWQGGRFAREAKALIPSSAVWARDTTDTPEIFYQTILDRAVRAIDPYVQLQGHWIVRRLAPDCARVLLAALPEERSETQLLHAMGWETANIHLGTKGAGREILRDLQKRKGRWLDTAAQAMVRATTADWEAWKRQK